MKGITSIILKGLAAVLPITITIYALYWLAITSEAFFGRAIKYIITDEYYWPGMGTVVAIALIMLIGILISNRVGQFFIRQLDKFIDRVPVANSIFNAVQDLMQFFASSRDREDMDQVVEITLDNGMRVIGFVTQDPPSVPLEKNGEDLIGVYIPMSYMIGGFTVYIPRSQAKAVDISVEKAMRLTITAGMTGNRDED